MQPPKTAWQDMSADQRFETVAHALRESIWSLETAKGWDEQHEYERLAQEFVEGDGPAEPLPSPGEIVGPAAESPLERVERQIRELKADSPWAGLSESRKLERLATLDWQGVPPLERLSVIEGAVDLTRVSPAIQRLYLGELRVQALQSVHDGRLPSLTAAILADPGAFLPEPGHSHDHGHDHGPDRGR
jgi:hypothetical protein